MQINPGLLFIWIAFGLVAGFVINRILGGDLAFNLIIGVVGAVFGGYVALRMKKS